jgi:phenylacetate-CoA ligase
MGAAWQRWIGSLRFWLIDLARGTRALALLRELEYLQFAPPGVLAARQLARRDAYAALVRRHSPLYRRHAGFDQFPVIDKGYANAHRTNLFNPAYRGKLIRKKTGGSTGEPFVYFTGVLAQSYLWAAILLSWRVAGYRLGEPVAVLAGSALFGSGHKQKIYYALMNARLLSAFDLSPAGMDACCAAIARCRLLYGYAAAIHRLALHILSRGMRPAFRLRAVVCTAEMLTPAMRATIAEAFGVPCFNQYGCNDGGVSAFECERRDGLHLVSERCWHEVEADGRLLATDLANDAFFLPRYDTGDRVALADGPCPCGRGFPLIRAVLGRANDLVEDSAGNAVHSEFFTHMFREDGRIKAFQVLYDARELVVIVHCAGAHFEHPPYLERIGAALRFDTLRFAVNRPFLTIANGKHRFVMKVDNVAGVLKEKLAG